MTVKRVELCRHVNGNTQPTIDGLALLLGVSVDHLLEVWNPQRGIDALPTDLKRRGQKRAKAARDAMGSDVANVGFAYWAKYQWGARIDFDEKAGQMWAVMDET